MTNTGVTFGRSFTTFPKFSFHNSADFNSMGILLYIQIRSSSVSSLIPLLFSLASTHFHKLYLQQF